MIMTDQEEIHFSNLVLPTETERNYYLLHFEQMLSTNTNLKRLHMHSNGSLRNKQSYNSDFISKLITILAGYLSKTSVTSLEYVNIGGCNLQNTDLLQLASAAHFNKSIKEIDFGNNPNLSVYVIKSVSEASGQRNRKIQTKFRFHNCSPPELRTDPATGCLPLNVNHCWVHLAETSPMELFGHKTIIKHAILVLEGVWWSVYVCCLLSICRLCGVTGGVKSFW